MAARMVERLQVKVRSVSRHDCRADGANAYRCDVALELEQGGVVTKVNAPLKLARGADGWVVVPN